MHHLVRNWSLAALALVGLGMATPTIAAEAYPRRCYGVSEGLAQTQVRAMLLDRSGFLWLGTVGGGLDRFDGQEFVNFGTDDGLPSSHVSALAEDHRGTIWIGTPEGLASLSGGRTRRFTTTDGLPSDVITTLFVGADDELWVGTTNGLAQRKGDRFVPIGPRGSGVLGIAARKDGALWLALGTSGLGLLSEAGLSMFPAPGPVVDVLEDSKGRTWAVGSSELWRIESGRVMPSGIDTSELLLARDLYEDRSGQLWVTGFGGALRIRNVDDPARATVVNALPGENVGGVLEDAEGGVWLATETIGACRLATLAFSYFDVAAGLPDLAVMSTFARGGEIWAGTNRGAVAWDGRAFRPLAPWLGPSAGTIPAVSGEADGTIWAGTMQELLRQRPGQALPRRWTESDGVPPVTALLADGPAMLVGTTAGIVRIQADTVTPVPFEDERRPWVHSLHRDRSGRVWVGTEEGAWLVRGNTVVRPAAFPELLRTAVVVSIAETADALWIGTQGKGVLRVEPTTGRITAHLTSRDLIADDWVFFLIADRTQTLWVGTRLGLDRVERLAGSSDGSLRSRHFGGEDGVIPGVETNQNTALEDARGDLWFGTIGGLVRYRHGEDREQAWVPRTLLTRESVYHETVRQGVARAALEPLLPGAVLGHGDNRLQFEFVAPAFATPSQLRYQFRLAGLDAAWSPGASARVARYSAVPPGSYRFEVRACVREACGPPSLGPSFTITPPLWKRPWMIAVFAAALLGTGHGLAQARVRTLRRSAARLEQTVAERTEELAGANAQLAAANDELAELSRTDALTGLGNRRSFEERLRLAWAGAVRRKAIVTLLMTDVDHFKAYNDHYGHPAGDRCLQSVGRALTGACQRKTDWACRVGGEEFAILLEDTDQVGGRQTADRLRRLLRELRLPHAASKTSSQVTISIGVATMSPTDASDSESLIALADEALYRAKTSGRDSVAFSSDLHELPLAM